MISRVTTRLAAAVPVPQAVEAAEAAAIPEASVCNM